MMSLLFCCRRVHLEQGRTQFLLMKFKIGAFCRWTSRWRWTSRNELRRKRKPNWWNRDFQLRRLVTVCCRILLISYDQGSWFSVARNFVFPWQDFCIFHGMIKVYVEHLFSLALPFVTQKTIRLTWSSLFKSADVTLTCFLKWYVYVFINCFIRLYCLADLVHCMFDTTNMQWSPSECEWVIYQYCDQLDIASLVVTDLNFEG